MELRTRILPKMLNAEVQEYLQHNDIIIVPTGTIEMHGGLPLDSETVLSEALALRMAEACDGLVLTGLPYFYAGATASGRGTVQVSIRQGIDYLSAIAHSLLRQGFKRQIYISYHGPAHMTCCPMVRDFFDETGVPILYMDMTIQQMQHSKDLFTSIEDFHALNIAAYRVMGRLEDVPLTTAFYHEEPQSCASFNDLFSRAYQSGAIGYCFAENRDHMSTSLIPDAAARTVLADRGETILAELVRRMDMPRVVAQMRELDTYNRAAMERYPWMPAAYNTEKG